MGYLVKTIVGAALFLGGLVLFNVKLQELLDIGTCASGNVPYEIAPGYECPEGTGSSILLMMGSIIGGLIGAAIFAFRGDPPWGRRRRTLTGIFGWGTFAWGLFFAGTGLAILLGEPYGDVVDPATGETGPRADSQLGGTIVAITFLVMGAPALLTSLWTWFKGLTAGGREERPATAPAGPAGGSAMDQMRAGLAQASGARQLAARLPWGSTGAGKGGDDVIGKLERLQRLKESGALSQQEFEREKAKLLAQQ